MARPLRIEFPGAFYHVMNRGNTGMDIYRSERDREKFLEYVGEAVKRYGIKVHTAGARLRSVSKSNPNRYAIPKQKIVLT